MKDKDKANKRFMKQLKEKGHLIDEVARSESDIDKQDGMPWKSEQWFGEILEAAPEMIFATGTKGDFLFTNRSWSEYTGYSHDDARAISIFDLAHPDDLEVIKERFIEVFEGNSLRDFEFKSKTKEGSYVDVQISLSPMLGSEGNVVAACGIGRKITECKQVEKELFKSEERWRSLVENAPNIIILVDRDRKIQFINYTVAGLDAEDVVGRSIYDYIQLGYQHIVEETIERVFETGEPAYFEIEGAGPNETISWYGTRTGAIKSNGEITGVIQIISDITELKQAEEALRESEQRFRDIFDSALDGICLADIETRQLYTCNRVFCQMLGYKLEEIQKMKVEDVHPEQDLPYVLERFNGQVRGEITLAKDMPVQRSDGSVFYTDINASTLTFGGKTYLMGIFRDITERKYMEEKYRRLLEDIKDGYAVVQNVNIAFANERFAEIFGYEPGQVTEHDITEFVAPDDLEETMKLYVKVTKGEEEPPERLEVMGIKRDGTIFPIQAGTRTIEYEGKPAYSVIVRDITERKHMDEMLQKSQEKLQSIIQALPDTLFHISRDGTLLDEPMGHKDLYNKYRGIFPIRTLYDIIPTSLANIGLRAVETALNDGAMQIVEHKIPIPPGIDDIYETRIVPFGEDEVLAISRNITDQKQSEERLRTYQQQLQSLTSQLSQAEEWERRRLAVDLHDLIGQSLAVIKMKLNAWRDTLYSSGHAKAMREVLELMDSTINNTRSLTFDLSPPVLYELGLEAGLESLLEQFYKRHAIKYKFKDDDQEKPLEDEVCILLYRCVSELLMNVVKHSKAKLVKISIRRENSQVSITLEDDGVGFAISETEGEAQGFGLFSIRERLNWIGGSFKLQSEPGCGTYATLKAPLKYTDDSVERD